MSPDTAAWTMFSFPSMLLGGMVGAAVICAVLIPYLVRLERDRAKWRAECAALGGAASAMEGQFKSAAFAALQASQEQFLTLAQEKLGGLQKDAAFDLEKRQQAIAHMVDPVAKTLKEVEGRLEILGQSGAVLEDHLKNFAADQIMLRQQTQALVSVLRNSSARGRWGEMQLQRTFEMVGMVENIHFRQQQTRTTADESAQRPDFVVHLPGQLSIVVDVKTPLEPYWALSEDEADVDEAQLRAFRGHLRDHVKKLSAKEYWRQFDSPQFVVMFLPTEGLFSLAVSSDRTLIEDAAMANVILASPTTILGLLRVVMHAWAQQALAENARAIGHMATELNGRMGTLIDHMQKLGRNLGTAVNAYNAAVGTVEQRVLPHLRKIEEYQGSTNALAVDLPRLEATPREILSVPASNDQAA
jgi:DNA recombination protein RmuC